MDDDFNGKLIEHWTFTMDYEANEIIVRMSDDGQASHIRIAEKDVERMKSWFKLARLKREEQ
jgi:hypothetical protein